MTITVDQIRTAIGENQHERFDAFQKHALFAQWFDDICKAYTTAELDATEVQAELARDMADTERRSRRMSPPGALNLPPFLERRRWQCGITDGAFKFTPTFNRVYLHQTTQLKGGKMERTSRVIITDVTKQREEQSAPEGIIVAMGLGAMDSVRSNGVDLGHKAMFLRISPMRVRVDVVDGKSIYLLMAEAGDLAGSEDLTVMLRNGQVRVEFDEATYQHKYIDSSGKMWIPSNHGTKPKAGF